MWTRAASAWLVALMAATALSCSGPTSEVIRLPNPTGRTTPAQSSTQTASSSTSASPSPTTAGRTATGPAASALRLLPVKGRAPKTGYSRAQFGIAWTDDVDVEGGHNGCDTRNDVLRRDLTGLVVKARTQGCVAASGTLHDPYTGRTIDFVRGQDSDDVQIDHVVALSDAWQTGAQNLTPEQRQNLANDPLELLAVDGPTNQSKGDGDAATWLPPDRSFRCAYVARQIAVKQRYRLWVTHAEEAAMAAVLAGCPGQDLPNGAVTDTPAIIRS